MISIQAWFQEFSSEVLVSYRTEPLRFIDIRHVSPMYVANIVNVAMQQSIRAYKTVHLSNHTKFIRMTDFQSCWRCALPESFL